MARSVSRYRCIDLAGVPTADRVSALRAQLTAWQPFPASDYLIDMNGGQAQVFALSREARESLPQARALWPETLLHPVGDDGLRLVACLEGVEGQCWRAGVLHSSRWWAARPVDAEWQDFARQAQAECMSVPEVQELPWQRPRRALATLDGLQQRLQGQERLIGGALAVALAGGSAVVAHGAWDAFQARDSGQAELQAVRDDVAPVLAARDRALADADRAAALVRQLQAPSPLEVLGQLNQLLPPAGRLKEFELRAGLVKLGLDLPPDVTRAKLVGDLEAGGWFTQVAEVKDGAGRGGVVLEMKLSGPRPPDRAGMDAGLTRSAGDVPAGPPSIDLGLLPGAAGSAPRGGKP